MDLGAVVIAGFEAVGYPSQLWSGQWECEDLDWRTSAQGFAGHAAQGACLFDEVAAQCDDSEATVHAV